jgi:hypothetical protein
MAQELEMGNQVMVMRIIFVSILSMALLLITQFTYIATGHCLPQKDASPKASPKVSQTTYNRVLDIVFPRDDPSEKEKGRVIFAFVLRFKPSFKSELQIVIRKREGTDKVKIIEYMSPDGSIYGKLNKILSQTGREDAAEMAKSITVRKRVMEAPYLQVGQWHSGFLESLESSLKTFRRRAQQSDKEGTITVFLDGTFYDLWYENGIDEISFSVYDEEINDTQSAGNLPLVQWMNTVRRRVSSLAW